MEKEDIRDRLDNLPGENAKLEENNKELQEKITRLQCADSGKLVKKLVGTKQNVKRLEMQLKCAREELAKMEALIFSMLREQFDIGFEKGKMARDEV